MDKRVASNVCKLKIPIIYLLSKPIFFFFLFQYYSIGGFILNFVLGK